MAAREQVSIAVFAGTFESQPVVFAHIFDLAQTQGLHIALDEVEVICKTDPEPRLTHYFVGPIADKIMDLMALNTTVVLAFPSSQMGELEPSKRLKSLGTFHGTRPRP